MNEKNRKLEKLSPVQKLARIYTGPVTNGLKTTESVPLLLVCPKYHRNETAEYFEDDLQYLEDY